MSPFEQHALAARISSQDQLIGALATILVRSRIVSAKDLAGLIDNLASEEARSGGEAVAGHLRSRAATIRANL